MGLNATVTPGINVTSSTTLDAANLNLLGTPTVSITGSIDSSDIGANTVGTSEIQANAVTQTEIGSIGGTNYILRGDSSGNGAGISTLAQDGGEDQISVLVNDKTDLKARMITGDLDVTTVDGNKLNLAIKDDSISASMLQANAASINVGNIEPGGGLAANGGKASLTSGEGGGILFFDPSTSGSIGDATGYFGKAKVLTVPKVAGEVLKSTASGAVAFGSISGSGLPIAYCQAYAATYIDAETTTNSTSGLFTFYKTSSSETATFNSGIHLIRRSSLTSYGRGVLRVFFNENLLSNGANLGVFGFGVNNYQKYQILPIAAGPVGLQKIDANGVEDLTNGTEYPYIDVKCVLDTPDSGSSGSNGPNDISETYLMNVNLINLTFYEI